MNETKTIAIIGGGFAGTTIARALDGRLPSGYELVLISEESHTTFSPPCSARSVRAKIRWSSARRCPSSGDA